MRYSTILSQKFPRMKIATTPPPPPLGIRIYDPQAFVYLLREQKYTNRGTHCRSVVLLLRQLTDVSWPFQIKIFHLFSIVKPYNTKNMFMYSVCDHEKDFCYQKQLHTPFYPVPPNVNVLMQFDFVTRSLIPVTSN